jgi:hypothetical protein
MLFRSMDTPPSAAVLTLEQVNEMRDIFALWRNEAAAAMYRTDAHARPYRAGCGEIYRLWNLMRQAIEPLERSSASNIRIRASTGGDSSPGRCEARPAGAGSLRGCSLPCGAGTCRRDEHVRPP